MNRSTERKTCIELIHSDHDSVVMVTPEDEDRFLLNMESAILGCALADQWNRSKEQYRQLLHRLHEWTTEHVASVRQAYVAMRDSGPLFLVVQKGRRFNSGLQDELTRLDLEIASEVDFDLIRMSTLLLPESDDEAVRSFLPQKALAYQHADRGSPHREGEP